MVRSVVLVGAGVFAYSVWDKSYDAHDQAQKIRKEALKIGTSAYDTVKSWIDALKK